jgi:hypothetical protein
MTDKKRLNIMENNAFLEDIQDDLKQIVQPFQKNLKIQQKKADFIKQCIRYADRDDFIKLDEALKTKLSEEIKVDQELKNCAPVFESLKVYANEKVEKYRIQIIKDLERLCNDAELEIDIDFPRFASLKGIKGEIDFNGRSTKINKKILKSIDPRRIVTRIGQLKRQLYDKPYDPQKFIDSLYQIYTDMLKKENLATGHIIPIQKFYLEYVISLQTKTFFINMDKAKFKGYSLDQFSVDLWRYFDARIGGTSSGHSLQLDPGRVFGLWLIDNYGEDKKYTGICFQKN